MTVKIQRVVDAAVEDVVQHEVHRVQVRQQMTRHAGRPAGGEAARHGLFGELVHQQRVQRRIPGDHADVGPVALVAGAGVRERVQHHGLHAAKLQVGCSQSRGT